MYLVVIQFDAILNTQMGERSSRDTSSYTYLLTGGIGNGAPVRADATGGRPFQEVMNDVVKPKYSQSLRLILNT